MPKAARVVRQVAASSVEERSESGELVSVALFSGIGLLISLVAVLLGIQGAWF